MNDQQLEAMLRATFDDKNLSRSERGAMRGALGELDPRGLDVVRAKAFALVREHLERGSDVEALEWLEGVVKALDQRPQAVVTHDSMACFAPGAACLDQIVALTRGARATIDVCVFTITDDRIAGALAAAHQRGVTVRIVTDDEKAQDLGSDIASLHRAGIPVVTDEGADHMHHKFAIFDARRLLTGSFNWTRSASERNLENFVVTNDPGLLRAFQREFDRLWTELPRM
ncbi:MAG: nuclease [Planctomycetes bacterium]|nr:nuclease [Planctomycetota bacterium]